MSLLMRNDTIQIHWSDCVVLFSALINNIQELRNVVADEDIDDGELYEAEQSLNDYVTVLARLRDKYNACTDKGALPEELVKELSAIF